MTPATEALLRRIAAAPCPKCNGAGFLYDMSDEGHNCVACSGTGRRTSGLLDECPLTYGWDESTQTYRHRPDWHPKVVCECGGTGCVLPSEAECFWRLTLAMGACDVELTEDGWLAYEDWRHDSARIIEEGATPLDALAIAAAKSLGLEATA
jgi:hypothetical protein